MHFGFRISAFTLCLVAYFSHAAETNLISPQTIVSNALAHSHQLKILASDLKVADARREQARAQGLPRLDADARAHWYAGLEDARLGPGVNLPAIENRYGVGATVSQPAYTGGRIKALKESAAQQRQAAQYEQRGTEADIALEALMNYWNWSKAAHSLESLAAAVIRMEAHAKDMRNLHEAGLATDNDSLATEVLLDRTRLRQEEAKRRKEVAEARIAFLTGQALPESSQPETAAPAAAADAFLAPEPELILTALKNRSERATREMQAKVAQTQVRISKADLYPQVSLVARYEQANPNLNIFPPKDRWQDDAFAGISVSWNIFDWGLTKAKTAEASARAQQAHLRIEQIEDRITLEVREARINLQDALARLAVAERVETSAQRNLKAATDLWQNGLARHSDVLDAHAQLTDSQYEIIAARADVAAARAAMEHALGKLRP